MFDMMNNTAEHHKAYDMAYCLGYQAGYHGDQYVNSYCRWSEAPYRAKFKNGYSDGQDVRHLEKGQK